MTEVYGKRINKKQAQILEDLFSYFDTINEDVKERGIDSLDMSDTSEGIVGLAEDLYLSFGKKHTKLFQ